MRNWVVLIITSIFIIKAVFAAPVTMPKKWNYLNSLVDKEIKTIQSQGKKLGPRLRYRLVELYTEKVKLQREKENKEFLNATNEFRQKVGKDYFYRDSMKYFHLAKEEGLRVFKVFPRFVSNGEIFYTLALNERDYNASKDMKGYLEKALKYAEAGSPTIHKAKVALAEYYYNEKEFEKAIKYYKDVLLYKRDQWYSKHLYNASWCYLKVNDNAEAIKLLKLAFEYSQKKEYINIDDQVYKSIGLFYVTAETPLKAVDFYLKKSKNPHPHLLGLADMTFNRGNIKDTETILTTAIGLAIRNKNYKNQAEVLQKRLLVYHHFKRSLEIFKTAKALLKIKKKHGLDVTIHDDTVEKVTNHVGFLQVSLTTNIERFDQEEKDKKSKRIISFFNLLIAFNKQNTDRYRFYQGETLYAVSKYEESAKLYMKSLEFSKEHKPKDMDFKRKTLNSLFSALAIAEMTSDKIDGYHKYAYENFLSFWPKDEKAPEIYKKLFNIHMKEKKADEATKVFTAYNTNFTTHNEVQKGMVTLLIDHYVKEKDFNNLSEWMIKLDKGFLGFKKDYIEKGLEILASMLFKQYEKLSQEGKFDEAVKGYISLYENEKYPRIIHAQSAYNIAIMYLDKGWIKTSHKWLNLALLKYNEKEVIELKDKIYAVSENYYLLQSFMYASQVSSTMVKTLCRTKHNVLNNFYQNSVTFQLLESDFTEAITNYDQFQKCNINENVRIETAKNMIAFHLKNRNYSNLIELNTKFRNDSELHDTLVLAFIDAYWDTKLNNNVSGQDDIKKVLFTYRQSPDLKSSYVTSINNIESFEKYEAIFKRIDLKIVQDNSKFSEEAFNVKLQTSFAKLEEFTKNGEEIIKEKHPIMSLAVYQMLQKKYLEVTSSLSAYTPQQMPKEYVTGFKQQMGVVASQLEKKGEGYKEIAIETMEKNNIFNEYGKEISGAEVIEDYRYPASKLTIPLDFNTNR